MQKKIGLSAPTIWDFDFYNGRSIFVVKPTYEEQC